MAAIIFDFDGTMADSFDYIVGFLAHEAGKEPLGAKQEQALRGHSMFGLARQFGFSWWRLIRLFFKGRNQMSDNLQHIQPFDGIPDIIRKLHGQGHELFIVTSNTVRTARAFLHQHNLHTYFLEIYGGVSLFGKAPALRRVLREHHLDKENAVYIGDELRDVEASQSIGLRVIAVTWGFARTADLEELRPSGLAHTPDDLIRILEEL